MPVQAIKSFDEFKTIINGDKIVVIDFWATWCGPCRMISPIFEKLSDTAVSEKIAFYKVDVDEQEQISQECRIKAMPTFIFFKGGEVIETITGADPGKLNQVIQKLAA
ncbi:thioredoxin [Violaceomyces palustris]|uniref:Thioredoxin n=1 Tax=Violaceomyces palustris TaxID=1673888 RepID=A0ACD0P200_9BASI|nr:thioredoxin [Violaceomyces palustris]